jgi:ribosome biogenesis GTPase A
MSDTASIPLVYSARNLERELLNASEDFTAALRVAGAAQLFGSNVNAEIAAAHRTVRDHLASAFSIMVVGDFKRGKSTLINALIGQAVAPVDVQPETISINHIEYAPDFTACIESQDGAQASLSREDLKRERLEPLLRRLATPIRNLRVGVPATALKDIAFVDTPGLGDLFQQFEKDVRAYVANADMIIYVLSATSPLSATEQDFLLSAIAPRHFPKVFLVMNATDVLSSEHDEQRVLNLVAGKLARIMPGSRVYGLSALDEWSRVSGGTRPNQARTEELARAFAAFRNDLDAAIRFRQRYFVIDRAAYAFEKNIGFLEQRTAGLHAALERDLRNLALTREEIERRQQSRSEQHKAAALALDRGFGELRRQAELWMNEFLERFQHECIERLRSMESRQIRQHLPFFLKDRLRRALEACLLAH